MKYYLIGIKGSGMSALALMLNDLGYEIVGSDVSKHFFTEDELIKRGIKIYEYSLNNLYDEYIYISSSADMNNIELLEVKKRGYKMFFYHEFIGLIKGYKSIAVSGCHGKTTTTSLIAHVLKKRYKINAIIGDGTGYGINDADYFVYEACEYKNHFLSYYPDYAIILNIDNDHLDFFKDIDEIKESFIKFSKNATKTIYNDLYLDLDGISFGKNIKIIKNVFPYEILINDTKLIIPFYGKHMIYNTVAAYLICNECGISSDDFNEYILDFKFPKRRFNEFVYNDNLIIDDYAHHPSEIEAMINTLREKYKKKLIVIFQPHTYSRTIKLLDDFIRVLKMPDEVFIDDIFQSAREYVKHDSDFLINKLNAKSYKEFDINNYSNCVIAYMGAGNINEKINYL